MEIGIEADVPLAAHQVDAALTGTSGKVDEAAHQAAGITPDFLFQGKPHRHDDHVACIQDRGRRIASMPRRPWRPPSDQAQTQRVHARANIT